MSPLPRSRLPPRPLLRPRTLWLTALPFLALLLLSLPGRPPHIDDAWIGEWVWWLRRDGIVRSELFCDVLGWDRQMFVFHKLFVLQGALATWIAGWSLWTLKATSLVWLGGALALIHATARRGTGCGRDGAALAVLLLLAHTLIQLLAFTFRPEVMLMTFGLATWAALARGRPGVAAVFAGLAPVVHLAGLVYIGAGVATLLAQRRARAAVVFGIVAAPIASLYLLDVLLADAWPIFARQIAHDPGLRGRELLDHLTGLVQEPRRWLLHGEGVGLSLLLVTALLTTRPWRQRRCRPLLVWTASTTLLLGLVAPYGTAKYNAVFIPFWILVVAQALHRQQRSSRSGWRRTALVAAGAVFLAICASRDLEQALRKEDRIARNARITRLIDDPDARVLAPMRYIFDGIAHHEVVGMWRYRLPGRPRDPDTLEVLRDADRLGITHIVLDRLDKRSLLLRGLEDLDPRDLSGFYRLVDTPELLILARR